MKHLNKLVLIIISITFFSCEVVQEVNFNEDKSGTQSLSFSFSEMMNMGMPPEQDTANKLTDTMIRFSDFLEQKKDSISKLSKEKQEKIKQLENFSLYIDSDSLSTKLEMKINYYFKDLKDLALFSEKLKDQDIKELDQFTTKIEKSKKNDDANIFDFNTSFKTIFNNKNFSLKITPETLEKIKSKKDSTLTKDNPMLDLMRFKVKYTFPYRIKKISNKNAKILYDFKGFEISANVFEMENNPKHFDVEVEFEKD